MNSKSRLDETLDLRVGQYFHLLARNGAFAGLDIRQGIIRRIYARDGNKQAVYCTWFSYLDGRANGGGKFTVAPGGTVEYFNPRKHETEYYTIKTYPSDFAMRTAHAENALRLRLAIRKQRAEAAAEPITALGIDRVRLSATEQTQPAAVTLEGN